MAEVIGGGSIAHRLYHIPMNTQGRAAEASNVAAVPSTSGRPMTAPAGPARQGGSARQPPPAPLPPGPPTKSTKTNETFNYNPDPPFNPRRFHHDELVPDAIKNEERWCTPCRGLHDDHKIHRYEAYTVLSRLKNLGLHNNEFSGAYTSGVLPVKLSYNDDKLVWQPGSDPRYMDTEGFLKLFGVIVDGLREQHEQYRYVAWKATLEMIDAAAERAIVHKLVPNAAAKLRLALNTLSEHFVALALYVVTYILRKSDKDPKVPGAMLPHLNKFLAPTCRFIRSNARVAVPPKGCLIATGRWETGTQSTSESRGPPPLCATCGKPCEVVRTVNVRLPPGSRPPPGVERPGTASGLGEGEARFSARPATPQSVKKVMDKASDGRKVERFVLKALVDSTLREMGKWCGPEGLRIIKSYIPTFEYVT